MAKGLWELPGPALVLLQALSQVLLQDLLQDLLLVVFFLYPGLVWVGASMELPARLVLLPVS